MSAKAVPEWRERALALLRQRPQLRTEILILLASAYFAVFGNQAFWRVAMEDATRSPGWALCVFGLLLAVNALVLSLLVWRPWARVLLGLLLVVSALAGHYIDAYGIYLDADMVRNVLHTDARESRDLLSWDTLLAAAAAIPALLALAWVRVRRSGWKSAVLARVALWLGVAALGVTAALASSQHLSALMRNQHQARYLVTPANYLVSLFTVLQEDPPGPKPALLTVAGDARQLPSPAGRKPRLLVMVVGETVRAGNWGLNGYARQTTPELLAIPDVLNFTDVSACGTSTEVSLPCMFSPYGRTGYDKKKIRSHESLLHVLARAGVSVEWRDNQSGCKGVCQGLPYESTSNASDPAYCGDDRCLDGILLERAATWMGDGRGDRVVVLHMVGNHGPNYFQRYPPEFRRYTPVCETADLGDCSPAQIVNAYDNAIGYTDHVLARLINLIGQQSRYHGGMIYVSDHGESLGEKGLFLHGVPYAIAPDEQTRVPMTMWFSPGFLADSDTDRDCLAGETRRAWSHDNLFDSVLGIMDVQTGDYRRERDLFAACRQPAGAAGAGAP
ncbi:phosphoethanolamine transferase [Pseudoxanthomonas kalamensis DSM 18571]|uniref:phosphoethanolamine transferase n=1 Tax=Pseudoxanthomonas kalamensis TaxID=289483 RepID=UPI0013913C8B|nr:phosphoethanolamine transferase [Pseudoxanthomonas kalamensis DSM 18571]